MAKSLHDSEHNECACFVYYFRLARLRTRLRMRATTSLIFLTFLKKRRGYHTSPIDDKNDKKFQKRTSGSTSFIVGYHIVMSPVRAVVMRREGNRLLVSFDSNFGFGGVVQ